MEKSKSYYRDDNDIAGGDESGAPHGGVLNTDLLEAGGKGKKQSTGNSSLPEKLSGGSVPDPSAFSIFSGKSLFRIRIHGTSTRPPSRLRTILKVKGST